MELTTEEFYWDNAEGQELLGLTQAQADKTQSITAPELILKLSRHSKQFGAERVRQAVEIVCARSQARRLGLPAWTDQGFFTRQGLEQATHPEIADYHARPFTGLRQVLEICSGSGFDTAALAKVVSQVVTIEADLVLSQYLGKNLSAQGIKNVKILNQRAEDAIPEIPLAAFDGLWADPSRRAEDGSKLRDAEQFKPALSLLQKIQIPRIGIKLGPTTRLAEIDPNWTREWIGYGSECRELIIWKGTGTKDKITLVDKDITWSPSTAEAEPEVLGLEDLKPGMLILEPHNALIASDDLSCFIAEQGWSVLDREIAYAVTHEVPSQAAWATAFRVIEHFPFSIRMINQRLAALNWNNQTELKKRGFPETSEELRTSLNFVKASYSKAKGVIIVCRVGSGHHVFLADRVA